MFSRSIPADPLPILTLESASIPPPWESSAEQKNKNLAGKVLKKNKGNGNINKKKTDQQKSGAQNFLNLSFLLHSKTHPRFFPKKKMRQQNNRVTLIQKKPNVWNLKTKNNKPTSPFTKKKMRDSELGRRKKTSKVQVSSSLFFGGGGGWVRRFFVPRSTMKSDQQRCPTARNPTPGGWVFVGSKGVEVWVNVPKKSTYLDVPLEVRING